MNAKTCKKLRRAAEAATIKLPERRYVREQIGSPIILVNCTSAAYQQLKAHVRGTPA